MAFSINGWGRISSSANNAVTTLQDGTRIGAPNMFTYTTSADAQAAIAAANYFATVVAEVQVGDFIWAVDSANTPEQYVVTAVNVTAKTITIMDAGPATGDVVGTPPTTVNAFARYTDATGLLIKNSAVTSTNAGEIAAGSGSVALPTYSFTGDTDTGMWRSAANTIDFSGNTGRQFQIASAVLSVNWAAAIGGAAGAGLTTLAPGVFIPVAVADANSDFTVQGKGTGGLSITPTATGTGATLRMWNPAGTFWNAFVMGANAANVTYTLPVAAPTANGQALVSTIPGVMSWSSVQAFAWSAQPANFNGVANNGYILTGAGPITMTLPAVAAVGDIIKIINTTAGGFTIAQNAGQSISTTAWTTTVGVVGTVFSVAGTHQYTCIEIVCVVANTQFVVANVYGPINNT